MFLAQNYPIRQGKAKPSRRPRGGGGGGGCAAAGVRRGCRRVVVPPRFVTVPCLCVALGGIALSAAAAAVWKEEGMHA